MAITRLCNNSSNVIFGPCIIVILVAFLRAARGKGNTRYVQFIRRSGLRTTFRHFILFRVLLVFVRNDNPSTPRFATYRNKFRSINNVRNTFPLTNARRNVSFVGRRSSISFKLLGFISGNLRAFFGFTFMLNTNRRYARVRKMSLFILRILKSISARSAINGSLCSNHFANAQFASGGQIILNAPTRGLRSAPCLFIATSSKVRFTTTNYFIRVSNVLFR